MKQPTTKPRFDTQFATGLLLLGALSFAGGVGLRAYQHPAETPQQGVKTVEVIPPPAPVVQTAQVKPLAQPQARVQPRVVRIVRVIRRPVIVTRGS